MKPLKFRYATPDSEERFATLLMNLRRLKNWREKEPRRKEIYARLQRRQ
jgi:hypothetical protein